MCDTCITYYILNKQHLNVWLAVWNFKLTGTITIIIRLSCSMCVCVCVGGGQNPPCGVHSNSFTG